MDRHTFEVLNIVNEIKAGAFSEMKERRVFSSACLLFVMIDVCASLAMPADLSNSKRFVRFLDDYSGEYPGISNSDLWWARSSMLHSLAHIGHGHEKGKAVPIYFYCFPDRPEDLEAQLRADGLERFHVMDILQLKLIAVRCYNAFTDRLEEDAELSAKVAVVAKNLGKDLLFRRFLAAFPATLGNGA